MAKSSRHYVSFEEGDLEFFKEIASGMGLDLSSFIRMTMYQQYGVTVQRLKEIDREYLDPEGE